MIFYKIFNTVELYLILKFIKTSNFNKVILKVQFFYPP